MRYLVTIIPEAPPGLGGILVLVILVVLLSFLGPFSFGLTWLTYGAVLLGSLLLALLVSMLLARLDVPRIHIVFRAALALAVGGWAVYVFDDMAGGPDRREAALVYSTWTTSASEGPAAVNPVVKHRLADAGMPQPGPEVDAAVFRTWQVAARDAAPRWYPKHTLDATTAVGQTRTRRVWAYLVFPSLLSWPHVEGWAAGEGLDTRCVSYACVARMDVLCTAMVTTPEEAVGLRPPLPLIVGWDKLHAEGPAGTGGTTSPASRPTGEAVRRLLASRSPTAEKCRVRLGLSR